MADVQHQDCSHNGTARIWDDLHHGISQHGCSKIETPHIDTYCEYQSMIPSIRLDSPQLIASSHYDKEGCKEATGANMEEWNFEICE